MYGYVEGQTNFTSTVSVYNFLDVWNSTSISSNTLDGNNVDYNPDIFKSLAPCGAPAPTTTPVPTVLFLNLEAGIITTTTVEILATVNLDADVYFVTLPRDADEPTSQQVKDGTDANDNTLPTGHFGNDFALANVEHSQTSTNLTPATDYDIWAVAQNNPLQASPTLLQATTLALVSSSCNITAFDGILYTPDVDCKNPNGVIRTITGTGFTANGCIPDVLIDDISVEVISYTDTEIQIIMPNDLSTGPHTLKVECL